MIRCSIWTLPFDKIRFSQLNTASAGIVTHCCFFSARTEEMPEVIVLDHVLIALNFSAKLCVFTFQIRCAEFAANGFVLRKLLLQTGNLFLEPCNQPVCRVQSFLQLGFLFLGCNVLLRRRCQRFILRTLQYHLGGQRDGLCLNLFDGRHIDLLILDFLDLLAECRCLLLLLAVPMSAAAADVDSGGVYCFGAQEFGEDLEGVCLRQVPSSGTLRLGNRVLRPGDVLTREQLDAVTYTPERTEDDAVETFSYLGIDERGLLEQTSLTLGIRGKENKPPIAEDSALETYKNLANTGMLRAKDPEGEMLTFTVTRQPRRGEVTIGENGAFTYTPKNNKVGVDSFAYTATDPQGKVSREATVTVTILRPTEPTAYTDTFGRSCAFSAEWMRSTGIFAGETLAGSPCFFPEKNVTKGEFLTMVVKTLSVPVEDTVDAKLGGNIPQWLRPYATAALRAGLTAGTPWQGDFEASDAVTAQDAAALLCACLDLDAEPEAHLAALEECGLSLPDRENLTREDAANVLYQLSGLLKT